MKYKNTITHNILKILSFLMILYSFILYIIGIRNTGPLFLIIIACILLFIIYTKSKYLKYFFATSLILYTIFLMFFIIILYKDSKYENEYGAKNSEYIVILGSGLKYGTELSNEGKKRVNKAIDYYKQFPHLKIFLTGGQGPDEKLPESVAMKNFLIENGIPENKIFLEIKSTNTHENIKYFLDTLKENNLEQPKSILLVTSDFHMPRAKIIGEHYHLVIYPLSSKTRKISFLTNIIREELAYIKTYLYDLKKLP